MLNLGKNSQFFVLCVLEIWWMTLKNTRAPFLCYFKLYASFRSQWSIQTGVTVWKLSIRVRICDFLSRMTLKFERWPWKIIGHLFCATSRFVHHFVAIGQFKLELQSRNTQFMWNSVIFVPLELEIWQMTLKKSALLLCHFKLCASLHSHQSIKTGVTVQKCPIRFKIHDFCSRVTWHWRMTLKNNSAPLLFTSIFVNHFATIP